MATVKRPVDWTNALLTALPLVVCLALLSTYLDRRDELITQRDSGVRTFDQAQGTMQKEAELRQFLAGPGKSMTDNAAAVESQVLHLVHGWEDQTQVHDPSFQRVSALAEHGFTCLTFQISASGTMGSVAALLYRVESAPVPLRVDSVQVRPKSDNGEQVQLFLTFSALCRGTASKTPMASAAGGG
jgi:hypothetical protein